MFKYILLGAVQGLTEFLPVSSSGHLLIAQNLLGLSGEEIALAIVLHLGTLIAVVVFFFKEILEVLRDKAYLALVILVTFITGVIGLIGKDFFEGLFSSTKAVVVSFLITGVILLLTRNFMSAKNEKIGTKDALILGFTQAIAILPGISRSGITISTLLFRKIEKEACFKFSFLISIPLILGATLLEIRKIGSALEGNLVNLTAGFVASVICGLIALFILKAVIKRAKFYYFGYYCILVALLTLIFIK